ncbi:MAG: alpha/beta hydrolase [Dehalococcoidia bacterium]
MPLHPQAQRVLEALAKAGVAPLGTLTPEEHRAAGVARRVPPRRPEAVHHVEDLLIPGPAGDVPARLYRPSEAAGLPLLVWFHGGGWTIGDLDGPDLSLRKIANRGECAVLSIDYRLAPEHRYPAAVEDSFAAVQWASAQADTLGVDATRLAVGGESAGGNLAAVVSIMARDLGGPAIAHQALIYPVTDWSFDRASYSENAEGYLLTKHSMEWFWGHYLGPDGDGSDWRASPLRAERLDGLPRAHIVTAEFDPLRDEGAAYAERLQDAGVPVVYRCYEGQIHGFFTMTEAVEDGEHVVTSIADELRATFSQREGATA